jgi:hypothetical protein
MFSVLLVPIATAFTCPPSDSLCDEVVLRMADANAAYGGPDVVHDLAPVRLQPASVVDTVQRLVDTLDVEDCLLTAALPGSLGGAYDSSAGTFDGAADLGVVTGTLEPGRRFAGTLGGRSTGVLFARYNRNRQFVADRDDGGFFAGEWIRVQGRRGVFIGVHGTCDGSARAPEAFERIYRGDLDPWTLFHPFPPQPGVPLEVSTEGVLVATDVTNTTVTEAGSGTVPTVTGDRVALCPGGTATLSSVPAELAVFATGGALVIDNTTSGVPIDVSVVAADGGIVLGNPAAAGLTTVFDGNPSGLVLDSPLFATTGAVTFEPPLDFSACP